MFVMLKHTRKGNLHRSVRNDKGEILKTLEFSRREPIELTDKADIAAIQGDLGKALIEVELREGRFRPVEGKGPTIPAPKAEAEKVDDAPAPKKTSGKTSK